jgi:hypothetical protein
MVVFLLIATLKSLAQDPILQVLSSPLTDMEMAEVWARQQFLEENKFRSPLFRELDFRVRSNDTQANLDSYRLRLGLLNPMEMKANKKYETFLHEQQSFEVRKKVNDVLLRRYELLIDSYQLAELMQLKSTNIQQLREIQSALAATNMDISFILDLEYELSKQELALRDLQQQSHLLNQAFENMQSAVPASWKAFEFVSNEQILSMMESLEGAFHVAYESELLDVKEDETILKLKKAEAFSNIGFIQGSYEIDHGKNPQNYMGFQMGVAIPIFNKEKPDLQRRELDLVASKAQLEQLEKTTGQQSDFDKEVIVGLIAKSKLIEEKLAAMDQIRSVNANHMTDLKDLKKMADYHLFLHEKKINNQVEIVSRFIQKLYDDGQLSGAPYHNFLSSDLTEFTIVELR